MHVFVEHVFLFASIDWKMLRNSFKLAYWHDMLISVWNIFQNDYYNACLSNGFQCWVETLICVNHRQLFSVRPMFVVNLLIEQRRSANQKFIDLITYKYECCRCHCCWAFVLFWFLFFQFKRVSNTKRFGLFCTFSIQRLTSIIWSIHRLCCLFIYVSFFYFIQ